ncbi:MAG: stage II sporulation protein M [Proteobacteria bacterium]|nr:stage II sporulation protein M [Pseudomonadota bacterium]
MDQSLRSLRFRLEREATWERLEQLLHQAERRSAQALSDEDMLAIPALYRATLSSLSVARATSLDQALVDYLEALSARAYFFVYGARTTLAERVLDFFVRSWPRAVQAMWRETLAAALVTGAGLAAAYFLVRSDPSYFFSFVPESLAGGRDPTATTEALRATLYAANDSRTPLGVFAAFLFTHNAQISLFAFALGIAFCLPSVLLIAYNGCTLGAMLAVFDARGLAFPFAGWILVHGVTELFAIMLAGAAGIRIGWAVAFPGTYSRLQAAERSGREGGVAMLGVVIMLFVAGILEGFARQLVLQDGVRLAIAAASALVWFSYFYFPRRWSA